MTTHHPALTSGPAPLSPVRRLGTGFAAYIDQLLHDIRDKTVVHGYVRSRYTVEEVVRLALARFPEKNPASIKKVVKVRPRHLERQKTNAAYDEVKNRAPRWRWVGPGHGTGYMHRIDELIDTGRTMREIATLVCREFGKDMEAALVAVRIRAHLFKRRNGREANFKRVVSKDVLRPKQDKRAELRARNEQLAREEERRALKLTTSKRRASLGHKINAAFRS